MDEIIEQLRLELPKLDKKYEFRWTATLIRRLIEAAKPVDKKVVDSGPGTGKLRIGNLNKKKKD